jgi:hypothetical protein
MIHGMVFRWKKILLFELWSRSGSQNVAEKGPKIRKSRRKSL